MTTSPGRIRRVVCVTAAAAAVAAGMTLSAVPAASGVTPHAAAAGDSTASYFSRIETVKSSTHKALHLELSASHESGYVYLSVDLSSGGESHYWSWHVPAGDFSASASGHGTLKASLGKYGKISLRLSSGGKAKHTSCNAETTTNKPTDAKGIFFFNTRSSGKHKWGTVGSKHSHLTFKKGTVTTFTGSSTSLCFTVPCPKSSVGYGGGTSPETGPASAQISNDGITMGSHTTLTGTRSVTLGKVIREDSVSAKGKRLSISASGGGHSLTIKPDSKLVSGSGVVSTSSSATTTTCKSTTTSYWSGGFTSHKLTFHAQIFGNIKPASQSTGYELFETTKS